MEWLTNAGHCFPFLFVGLLVFFSFLFLCLFLFCLFLCIVLFVVVCFLFSFCFVLLVFVLFVFIFCFVLFSVFFFLFFLWTICALFSPLGFITDVVVSFMTGLMIVQSHCVCLLSAKTPSWTTSGFCVKLNVYMKHCA